MAKGSRIPPGPSLYAQCGKPGRAGVRKHQREGTPTCQPCRDASARAYEAYRLRRRRGQQVQLVDSTGTSRRIRALACRGWTFAALSGELGLHHSRVYQLAHGVGRLHPDTVEAVRKLYERLWNTDGVPGKGNAYARALAAKNGWLPPMEWDDDLIDDPTYVPHAIVMRDWASALEENRERRKRGAPSSDNDARGWNTKIIESDYEEWTAA